MLNFRFGISCFSTLTRLLWDQWVLLSVWIFYSNYLLPPLAKIIILQDSITTCSHFFNIFENLALFINVKGKISILLILKIFVACKNYFWIDDILPKLCWSHPTKWKIQLVLFHIDSFPWIMCKKRNLATLL